MPHPLRFYENKRVYFVTNRVAEGLPFVANIYINLILFGILARARALYPKITICAWGFLGNHYHGIIILNGSPVDLKHFMNYIDGEIAKSVKRWLGKRTNCKIWAQRYHAALLATPEDVITRMIYLFANPVTANLTTKVSQWFGLSTFTPALDTYSNEYKWLRPGRISPLPNKAFTKASVAKLLTVFDKIKSTPFLLPIEPLAWLSCFEAGGQMESNSVKKQILDGIENREKEEQLSRKQEQRQVARREDVEFQNPHKAYTPTTFGRRVFCIAACPELRAQLIELYKRFCEACRHAWEEWKKGNYDCSYPPGAFLPPRPPNISTLPAPL